MVCDMLENLLPNAHTLQTQLNRLAQHGGRLASPYAEAQHGDSCNQQHSLRRRLFYMAQFHHPFRFSVTIIARES